MIKNPLAEEEIERRAPVWAAFSNLFVDTDVSLLRTHIAKELASSPYSETELLRILRDEAGPTFAVNLLSIAGEWVGWDASEARTRVLAYLRLPAPVRWLQRTVTRSFVERAIIDEWPSIRSQRILAREP